MENITVKIDKYDNCYSRPQYDKSYDGDFKLRDTHKAFFSDGSHCSCFVGQVGEPCYDDTTSSYSVMYGMLFYKDENSNMSSSAWEAANELSAETCREFEVHAVEDEPDYDKIDEEEKHVIKGIMFKFRNVTKSMWDN